MSELGQMLRDARETQGISLAQAEEATRIRRKYLEALEAADYTVLPPNVYVRGFIRNYAAYLGLDPEAAVAAYHNGAASVAQPVDPHIISEPLSPGPRINWELVAGVVMLALLGVVLVIVYRQYIEPLAAGDEAPPLLSALVDPDPTQTATLSVAALVDEPTATATVTIEPSPTSEPPTEVPPTEPPTATVTTTPMPTVAPTSTPQGAEELMLVVNIGALTWTRVSADGEIVFEGTLEPGEERTWTAQDEIVMRTGNAGGMQASINGRDLGVLGNSGQVLDFIWQLTGAGEVLEATP